MFAAPPQKCLTAKCVNKAFCYGLCIRCYGQAKLLVKSGRTTWEGLIAMGMAQEQQPSGFAAEFERREKFAEGRKRLKRGWARINEEEKPKEDQSPPVN